MNSQKTPDFPTAARDSLLDLAQALVPDGYRSPLLRTGGIAGEATDDSGSVMLATAKAQAKAGKYVIIVALSSVETLGLDTPERGRMLQAMAQTKESTLFPEMDAVVQRHVETWWAATSVVADGFSTGQNDIVVGYPSQSNKAAVYHRLGNDAWQATSGRLIVAEPPTYRQDPPLPYTILPLLSSEMSGAYSLEYTLIQLGYAAIVERHLGEQQTD